MEKGNKGLASARLFLLCEKCGSKQLLAGKNSSVLIQKSLKDVLKAQNLIGEFRPILSSCLGVCPEGKITAALLDAQGSPAEIELLNPQDPEREVQELLKFFQDKLQGI